MNIHQLKGQVRKIKGAAMERVGRLIGNDSLEHNGAAEYSAGRIQKGYGDTKMNMKRMLHRRMSRGGTVS